jgi:hypothetical protein
VFDDKNGLDSNKFLLLSSFMEVTCKVAAGCKVAYEVHELEGVDEGLVVDVETAVLAADAATAALLVISFSSKVFM